MYCSSVIIMNGLPLKTLQKNKVHYIWGLLKKKLEILHEISLLLPI